MVEPKCKTYWVCAATNYFILFNPVLYTYESCWISSSPQPLIIINKSLSSSVILVIKIQLTISQYTSPMYSINIHAFAKTHIHNWLTIIIFRADSHKSVIVIAEFQIRGSNAREKKVKGWRRRMWYKSCEAYDKCFCWEEYNNVDGANLFGEYYDFESAVTKICI